jgi:hypothetical protein
MDPETLKMLIPIISVLALFGCPVGIIWVVKNHQYRMKELEVESHRGPVNAEQRLASVEARLSAIETALGAPGQQRNELADRASLLEGPPTGDPVRQR